MRTLTYSLTVMLTLSAGITATGCRGRVVRSSSTQHFSGEKDGVVLNYMLHAPTCDGRPALLLAAEECQGLDAVVPLPDGVQAEILAADGRKIQWSYRTQDGRGGTATIDGRQFDLAKGAVFLISARQGKTTVEQVAIDASKLRDDTTVQFLGWAKTEPQIAAFYKALSRDK